MKSRDGLWVLLFAAARTVFCAYRAATQSLTGDEAFSYNNFIGGAWNRIYPFFYDTNNHVLYSILAKLSVHAFRTSEFTIRLPSVLAGFFFVLGVYQVLCEAVPSRAVRWVALIALSLHPLILDFSLAARGYGISLTFLAWAIYAFLRSRDVLAGILLGLSISSNLTILYPAAGLVICPFLLRHGDSEKRIQSCLAIAFAATGVFIALCYEALARASSGNFYAGLTTASGSLFNLIYTSIRGSLTHAGIFGNTFAAGVIQIVCLPLIAFFLWGRLTAWRGLPLRLAPLVMLSSSILGLLGAHYLMGLNYPVDRLGLYLVLLFGLSIAIAVSASKSTLLRRISGVLALLLIVQFVTQVHTRYFTVWTSDLAAKQIARTLLKESSGHPAGSIKVGVTWYLQPALEFYRIHYQIAALEPIRRTEPTPLDGCDFYLLDVKTDPTVRASAVQRLRPIYRDPLSEVLLAQEP